MLRKILRVTTLAILSIVGGMSYGQTSSTKIDLNWVENVAQPLQFSFNGAILRDFDNVVLPVYYQKIKVSSPDAEAIINFNTSEGTYVTNDTRKQLKEDFVAESYISSEDGVNYLNISILPLRYSHRAERLLSFDIIIKQNPSDQYDQRKLRKKSHYKSSSVLADGEWLKIRTNREGIFEITRSLLESGGWNTAGIDLSTIKVFGNGGGLLHEHIDEPRLDDLEELRVKVKDENGNNRLDANDRIFFYGQGAVVWIYDNGSDRFIHENHPYDEYNYYFITHGGPAGKRMNELPDGQGQSFDATIEHYEVMYLHEKDEVNFIKSGREWYGNSFRALNTQSFTHNVTNIDPTKDASIRFRTTARSTSPSVMSVSINGASIATIPYGTVTGSYEDPYAVAPKTIVSDFKPQSENLSLLFQYIPTSPEGDAWIDYYELAIPRKLVFNGSLGQYMVYSKDINNLTAAKYIFTADNYEIWDVTDHQNVGIQKYYAAGGNKEFITINPFGNRSKRYCAFDGESAFTPTLEGKVTNQNLHSQAPVNYVMVTHQNFIDQANRLAELHRSYYGSTVLVVDHRQIYNEFSSGKVDVVAIRDFLKMMYDRSIVQGVDFENVLLFGDGSYDYKDRIQNNTNFIPVFESRNSISPTSSYAADDFFAILEDGEGQYDTYDTREGLDVGIGRIPARSELQARVYVNKVVRYHSPDALGDWRNNVTLLGDDEDNNKHLNDSEELFDTINKQAPVLNVNKIYLDAFDQVSYGSGDKYPAVNDAIDKSFEKGHLLFNYLGHGGGSGMAHERVVTRTMINEWDNRFSLPLVITATCELSRYDDPSQDSPGELMLFNENGGAIGLITTTRLVIVGLNTDLNLQVIDRNLFEQEVSGEHKKLGQVFSKAANNSIRAINQRNFTLLGDPGIRLAYPKYNVVTTKVNDSLISAGVDTIKAFTKMRFEGEIRDLSGNLVDDFEGIVGPTVYDKAIEYRTLKNDPGSKVTSFYLQNSAIYRGKVSVTDGKFFFEFVVPKDIDYRYGNGKIVYYAQSADADANGVNLDLIVGGSGKDQIRDSIPPTIEIFLDDTEFIFGGLTGENTNLLVNLFDENGINTVGNGIGRNITATLDEDTEKEEVYVLNDFYQAKLNSYQEGEIEYRLNDLEEGRHTVKVKVWDVFNNSSEAYTEFVVAEDADMALDHVLNYPNPFTTFTTFHFDHNKSGRHLDVTIKILSPTGRVIKTLFASNVAAGGHFQGINWNGKDDYGDTIGRGVYVYKVSVKSDDGTSATEYQKLVILK